MGISGAAATPATGRRPRRGVDWGSVGLFLLLAVVLSWAAFIGLRAVGVPLTIRAGVGMYGPIVAAIVTRLVRREGFADFGLRPLLRTRLRIGLTSYVWAYVLPIVLTLAGVALALVIHYQHWALAQNWASVMDQLTRHMPAAQAAQFRHRSTILLTVQLAEVLTIGPLMNCLLTLGEEFGWRGHLLVRLTPLGGPVAAVLVGVVWGLWHAPLIALDGYEFGIRAWWAAPFFCLFTVPLAVILAWLRFRSGSVWPGVLLHAMVNAVAGFSALALSAPDSRLIGPPVGLIGCVPLWIVAIWLVATGRVRVRASRA
jgi:membrane protease YdiL (CAAX protease family)